MSARFTTKQGQYLAYIHCYSLLHRRAPSEADLETYFRVTPPSVHRMVLELHRKGLIARIPYQPRSLRVLVAPDDLPPLQPIKIPETGN